MAKIINFRGVRYVAPPPRPRREPLSLWFLFFGVLLIGALIGRLLP